MAARVDDNKVSSSRSPHRHHGRKHHKSRKDRKHKHTTHNHRIRSSNSSALPTKLPDKTGVVMAKKQVAPIPKQKTQVTLHRIPGTKMVGIHPCVGVKAPPTTSAKKPDPPSVAEQNTSDDDLIQVSGELFDKLDLPDADPSIHMTHSDVKQALSGPSAPLSSVALDGPIPTGDAVIPPLIPAGAPAWQHHPTAPNRVVTGTPRQPITTRGESGGAIKMKKYRARKIEEALKSAEWASLSTEVQAEAKSDLIKYVGNTIACYSNYPLAYPAAKNLSVQNRSGNKLIVFTSSFTEKTGVEMAIEIALINADSSHVEIKLGRIRKTKDGLSNTHATMSAEAFLFFAPPTYEAVANDLGTTIPDMVDVLRHYLGKYPKTAILEAMLIDAMAKASNRVKTIRDLLVVPPAASSEVVVVTSGPSSKQSPPSKKCPAVRAKEANQGPSTSKRRSPSSSSSSSSSSSFSSGSSSCSVLSGDDEVVVKKKRS